MTTSETELKLRIDRHHLTSVTKLPAIAAAAQGAPVTRLLQASYYDTPDFVLRRNGLSLRLRRKDRCWIQTVKRTGSGAPFTRDEWEQQVAGQSLDHDHLRGLGLALFQDDAVLAALMPCFQTKIRRTTLRLSWESSVIEMALDRGSLIAQGGEEEVSEIELEVLEGAAPALFSLAERICETIPGRLLILAKSDRGHHLASGSVAKPAKATPLILRADQDCASALSAIIAHCLTHLLVSEHALRGPHSAEAIHQMRVALRRLRSAFKIFAPLIKGERLRRLKAEIRWLLAHLGPARDADVFHDEILAPVLETHPHPAALGGLAEHWRLHRMGTLTQAELAADHPRFTRLVLDLAKWAAEAPWTSHPKATHPLPVFAAKVLRRCHRRLLTAGGKSLERLSWPDLHEVRILGKQMRYCAEFFACLYPRNQTKQFLSVLADLQESLGGLNDLAVAQTTLARLSVSTEHAWAAGTICGWHEQRRPALRLHAESVWKKVRKSPVFWD